MGKKSTEGIVVKVTADTIVLLCQDGTFQNVSRASHDAPPLIGERYTHIEQKISWIKWTSIASVFLLALISYMLFPFGQNDSSYVVAIDINPSIELTVNDEMKVIETSANNQDGETLLTTINIEGQTLSSALEKVILYSEDEGYFLENKFVTSSVIPMNEKKKLLIEEIEQIITNSVITPEIDVIVYHSSKETYAEAKKSNLSVNHYTFFKELENEGVVHSVEEVTGKTIEELRTMKKEVLKVDDNDPASPSNSNKPENVGPPEDKKDQGVPDHVEDAKKRKGIPPHAEDARNQRGIPPHVEKEVREKGASSDRKQKEKVVPPQANNGKEEKITPPPNAAGQQNKNP